VGAVTSSAEADVVRVVLVDDDALVRAGLKMILGGDRSIELVGEAADGVEALTVVEETRPVVVLMDIRMPKRDGLAATGLVRQQFLSTRVIVLTTFDTDESVLQALRIGASGFLLKDTPPDRLVEAVHTVARGEPILSPSVTTQLIDQVSRRQDDGRRREALRRLETLTEREREVAVAIGHGRSNADIGRQLYLSVPTVKAHVSRLLDKLGADNRVQIAICVHDADLV
jgi:DNA-binding NarL/FixJ family response regulator